MSSRFRTLKIVVAVALGPTTAAVWWYRPSQMSKSKDGPHRSWPYMSAENIHDEASDPPPFVKAAQNILIPLVVTFWRIVMQYSPIGGKIIISKDDNYERFLGAMANRRSDQSIITVANHRSLFDDPGLMCNILPWHMGIQPRFLRWNTCAQEVCFNSELPSLVSAFFLAGKSLPVWRGGGINQRPWLDFARHVANGEWCHVFPEAGIWQRPDGLLGGRGAEGEQAVYTSGVSPEQAGKLKWGIGKLIAHAPVTPVVVPFFHKGIEDMLGQDPATRVLYKPWYRANPNKNGLFVVFGEPLDFSDLIEEHEKKYGKLRKFSTSSKADSMRYALSEGQTAALPSDAAQRKGWKDGKLVLNEAGEVDFHAYWDSTAQEQVLYHKITQRIEGMLERLSRDADVNAEVQRGKIQIARVQASELKKIK